MKRHLTRWVHASVKDYIKTKFAGTPLVVEGENDKKPDAPFFIELRIDGPNMVKIGTRTEYMGMVEVNLLLTVNKDEKYAHILQDKIGLCWEALEACIPIKRVGSTDTAVDTGAIVSVLQLIDEDAIEINNFGQVDPNIRIQQASVEGHYRFQLELES